MPSKGTTVRTLRSPDEVWQPADARAKAEGTTLTTVINGFLREYGAITPPPRSRRRPARQ